MRGLIGQTPLEFEEELEDLRVKILSDGLEEELIFDHLAAKTQFLGSLEQSETGMIIGGPLTDLRYRSIQDLFYARLPYFEATRDAEVVAVNEPRNEEEARLEFLGYYKNWMSGKEIKSDFIKTS